MHLQCRRPGFIPWVGKIPRRKAWQPTPVFLPRESHGQRSLIGYSPWGCRVGHNCATTAQQRTAIQVETPLTLPPSVFMGARGLLHLQTSTPYPRWKVIAKVTFASQTCHFSIWKIICCKESPFGWLHLKSYCSESCHTIILRSKETSGIKNFNKTHCEPEYNHVSC